MKTREELNKEILETTAEIQENYPELSKFEDEMPMETPSDGKTEITTKNLQEYNDSLQAVSEGYAKNSTNHIVIIGAGFAGLKLARRLNNNPNYTITLIDKNNYHQFQPLFYQVAMANLDASNISFPLRNIFEKSKNVRIRVATVTNINTKTNEVETLSGTINFDYLVIATGAKTNYFGNSGIEKNVFSMKSTFEALQIRNTLLQHFEDAITANDLKTKILLSVVIVGGGPTGVELSGALAEMKIDSLPVEYPELNFADMNIYLLEGTGKLLSAMSKVSSQKAKEYLQKLGVTVMLNTFVKEYDGKQVLLQDAKIIESSFVIWAAGVKGNIPKGVHPDFISKSNQIKTDSCNLVINTQNVFALGDVAVIESEFYPKGFPQLASVAIDQAKNLANNFIRLAQNKSILPFNYINKGSMATVGRNKAVVDLAKPKLSFHGFFAWLIWMTLHLFLLISFKNRLIVFINWIYKYATHRQSLSLLFTQFTKKEV
ncbi:NAD(P)/FAD-dependent oxidoreductase [Flavobacterium sp.]|uniref:NAD(P)/FAD-dependent oxidoreductase n=1 Tax=Flavobacterium sp. TaxID=239 RepID=UPI003BE706D7